jgi:hypothetical protein
MPVNPISETFSAEVLSQNTKMEDMMGGACGTYGKENTTRFWREDLEERDQIQNLILDGTIKY